MSKIVILDADTLGQDVDLSPICSLGEVTVFPSTQPSERIEHIGDAQIVLVNKVKLGRDVLEKVPQLRLICTFATGYDVVDTDYCSSHGIGLCNVRGYSTESVVNLTVAMALQLSVHLKDFSQYVANGCYTDSGIANHLTPVFHDLEGKVWGIVGYGTIGRRVAEVARALRCKVVYFSKHRHENSPDEYLGLDELCAKSDIISLHLPLNSETINIINRDRIGLMKREVILINVGRGLLCDEKELANALIKGSIGGMGIDVYSEEPFGKNHPFTAMLNHPNVVLTPHMGWGSVEARCRCVDEVRQNIVSFLLGEKRNRIV